MRMALPTTMLAWADVALPTPAAIKAKAAKDWRRCIFPSLLGVILSFAAMLTPRSIYNISATGQWCCALCHSQFRRQTSKCSYFGNCYFHDRDLLVSCAGRPQKTILRQLRVLFDVGQIRKGVP